MKLHRPTLLVIALAIFFAAAIHAAPRPKVTICHFPPGNPANWHTITISENALGTHQDRHGDLIGIACEDASCSDLCNDGDVCTQDVLAEIDDCLCVPGSRPPIDCDDSNPCTIDDCQSADDVGCVNTDLPDGWVCVNEQGNDSVCSAGVCEPTDLCEDVDCDDGNSCTAGTCDPEDGSCSQEPIGEGLDCTDGLGTAGVCTVGVCEPIDLCEDVLCDDFNFCTTGTCNPADGTCSYEPANEDLECTDGQGADGVCTEGTCVPNPPPSTCNCGLDPATGVTDTGWSDDLFGLGSSPAGSLWDEAASGGWGSGIVSCSDDGTTVQVVRSDPEAGVTETVGVNASQCYGFDNGDIDGVLAIDSTAAELCRLSLLEGPCAGGGGPTCGDGVCEAGEDTVSCPQDCDAGPVCGNGVCEAGEDFTTCFADCGF